MKCCIIFLSLGLAAQLEASVLHNLKNNNNSDGDVAADSEKRADSASKRSDNEGRADSEQDKVTERDAIGDNKHRRSGVPDVNNVIAFGLDTGVPDSKNSMVQAITDAFGDITSLHARSNTKGYKTRPLALELTSDSVLRGLERLLGSPHVKKVARDLARKAAVIYRAVEKEL